MLKRRRLSKAQAPRSYDRADGDADTSRGDDVEPAPGRVPSAVDAMTPPSSSTLLTARKTTAPTRQPCGRRASTTGLGRSRCTYAESEGALQAIIDPDGTVQLRNGGAKDWLSQAEASTSHD